MVKTCARCKIEKEFSEFVKHKNKVNGLGPYCKLCSRKITNDRRAANPEQTAAIAKHSKSKPEYKEKQRIYAKSRRDSNPNSKVEERIYAAKHRKLNPEMWMISSAKARAKRDGLPFNLNLEDVIIPEFCPIFGTPLARGTGSPTANSPSLDKIIPELGYVKGNIQVISFKANAMKQDAPLEELVVLGEWAKALLEESYA